MFIIQQGWGMLSLMSEFIQSHNNLGIIFSPRVCDSNQLEEYLPDFLGLPNSSLFFDPYFYEPRTDLNRVLSYPYYSNYNFQTGIFNSETFCRQVIDYQINTLNFNNIILPGRFTNSITESWLEMHRRFADIGSEFAENRQIYSTISLGSDLILNQEHFTSLIDEVINYPIDGVYFVFEHPVNEFLINQELIYVLLDAFLSISLSNKKILLGYSNHQSLVFYASGVDFLATGNYRNVRSFDHLNSMDRDNDNLRKGVWYFDGNTFGEYKVQTLGLAFRRNLRNNFGPITNYNRTLLTSQNPSSVPFNEPNAFNNYLDLMHLYCSAISRIPKNQRANFLVDFLNERRLTNISLASQNFNFGERGFQNYIDETLAGLNAFIADRNPDITRLI